MDDLKLQMLMIQFELLNIQFLLVNKNVNQDLWNDMLHERSETILSAMKEIRNSQNIPTP